MIGLCWEDVTYLDEQIKIDVEGRWTAKKCTSRRRPPWPLQIARRPRKQTHACISGPTARTEGSLVTRGAVTVVHGRELH
jgi:hypothetical protein